MSISEKVVGKKKMWRAVVSTYDAYGKRHQKVSKWFDRKADAADAEAKLKAEQSNEKMAKTFGEVCAEWIEATKAQNVPKTYRDKYHMLNTYLVPIRDTRMDKIRPATLQKLFKEPDFLALGTSRRNRIRGIINSTFKYAMRIYDYPTNPVDAIDSYKKTEEERMRKQVVYTPEQFRKMLDQISQGHWEYSNVLTMLYLTGMRLNECLSLTFADLIGTQAVHVWRQYYDGAFHVLKTEGSERTISLPKHAQDVVQFQLDYYKDLPGFDAGWFLFGGPRKLPDNTVRNVANKAQKDAKLPHSRLHDLRHAHASVLLENLKGEGDILKVSKRLGHSSVTTTLNIYAHILDKSEQQVVDVLDGLFDNCDPNSESQQKSH